MKTLKMMAMALCFATFGATAWATSLQVEKQALHQDGVKQDGTKQDGKSDKKCCKDSKNGEKKSCCKDKKDGTKKSCCKSKKETAEKK